jgi:RNA polymerase sigma-70 factor, ECF subfamily
MAEETFESLRPMLFSLAYRMLGSVAEAEDVVQEAFLRQQRALRQGTEVESPKAFLSAVVTRLSIGQLRSARARREVYVGEWLPEPLLTDTGPRTDPAQHAEQADSLSLADGVVQTIRSVINPDKLGHLGPVADVCALMKQQRERA